MATLCPARRRLLGALRRRAPLPVGLLPGDGRGWMDRDRDPRGLRRRRPRHPRAAAVLEEVAASGACMNGASALHMSIFGMRPVILHGTDEMKQRYLAGRGRRRDPCRLRRHRAGCGHRHHQDHHASRAHGDVYRITGRKVWTSKALEADRILLLTRTTPLDQCTKPTQGMSLFLVDRHAPGVGVTPIPKLGRNAVASCETTYDDVVVPVADRVGDEGEGFRYLLDGLNAERVLIAAEALGIGRAALRRAVHYANERVVFGRPIGQNQGMPSLAEAHARLRAAALMVRAAERIGAGLPCGERPTSRSTRRRGQVLRRRPRRTDPRRLRLRHRVPRRAVLPRAGCPASRRSAKARPQLCRRARAAPAASC
ncbi:MAG: acyl-CoA dehydrogenase family protein [Ilumatobacteraceae bacterium]